MFFEVEHVFEAPIEAVEAAMFDPDYPAFLLSRHDVLTAVSPQTREEAEGLIHRKVHYTPRAVFDLTGGPEGRSLTAPAAPPFASTVRIGKQPAGTRIVVDLDDAPKRTKQLGEALVLGF